MFSLLLYHLSKMTIIELVNLFIELFLRKDQYGTEYTLQPRALARLQNLALLTDMHTRVLGQPPCCRSNQHTVVTYDLWGLSDSILEDSEEEQLVERHSQTLSNILSRYVASVHQSRKRSCGGRASTIRRGRRG